MRSWGVEEPGLWHSGLKVGEEKVNQQKAPGRAASEEGEKSEHCDVQEAKRQEVFRGGGSGQLCPMLQVRPSEGGPGSDFRVGPGAQGHSARA